MASPHVKHWPSSQRPLASAIDFSSGGPSGSSSAGSGSASTLGASARAMSSLEDAGAAEPPQPDRYRLNVSKGRTRGPRVARRGCCMRNATLQDLLLDGELPTPSPSRGDGLFRQRGGKLLGTTKSVMFSPSLLRLPRTKDASSVGTGVERARHVAKLTNAASRGVRDVVRS
jgi:hypothetical protein